MWYKAKFIYEHILDRHVPAVHEGKKPYHCEVTFNYNMILNSHSNEKKQKNVKWHLIKKKSLNRHMVVADDRMKSSKYEFKGEYL